MPRPPEPQALIDYRAIVKQGPPRCCHTCDNYTADGWCRKHQAEPPEEFSGAMDNCADYVPEVPF